jgi:hypothetical protein
MRHSRFFIDSACFVLLFDVVRDPSREGSEKNIQAVVDGLQCFTRLPADNLSLISTSAISRMLQLTRDLVAKTQNSVGNHYSRQPETTTIVSATADSIDPGTAYALAPTDKNGVQDTVNDSSFETVFEGTDFFDNDIFDLSYDLWLGDTVLPSLTW